MAVVKVVVDIIVVVVVGTLFVINDSFFEKYSFCNKK